MAILKIGSVYVYVYVCVRVCARARVCELFLYQ